MRYTPIENAPDNRTYRLGRSKRSTTTNPIKNQYMGGREKKEMAENAQVPSKLPRILMVYALMGVNPCISLPVNCPTGINATMLNKKRNMNPR
jgi:hypothetical protein